MILDSPVSSVATGLIVVLFRKSITSGPFARASSLVKRYQSLLAVAGLLGGPSFAAKTYLVLSDTFGTNFYIWCVSKGEPI